MAQCFKNLLSRGKKLILMSIGVAVIVSFVVYRAMNWQFEVSPDMILIAGEKQYRGKRGAYGVSKVFGGGFGADVVYVPPQVADIDKGTEIQLKVLDYWQPTEIDIYLYNYAPQGSQETGLQLSKISSYRYLVDIPQGDYELIVLAKWEKLGGSASAYYNFRIIVK